MWQIDQNVRIFFYSLMQHNANICSHFSFIFISFFFPLQHTSKCLKFFFLLSSNTRRNRCSQIIFFSAHSIHSIRFESINLNYLNLKFVFFFQGILFNLIWISSSMQNRLTSIFFIIIHFNQYFTFPWTIQIVCFCVHLC